MPEWQPNVFSKAQLGKVWQEGSAKAKYIDTVFSKALPRSMVFNVLWKVQASKVCYLRWFEGSAEHKHGFYYGCSKIFEGSGEQSIVITVFPVCIFFWISPTDPSGESNI